MFSARRRIKDGGGREIPSFFFVFHGFCTIFAVENQYSRINSLTMKKGLLCFTILLAGLMAAVPASAQLKFGVKGGLNIAKVKFDKSIADSDNRAGFFIGPMAEFTLPIVGLGVDAALLYDQKEMELDGEKEKTKYINIPINLKYSIGTKLAGVYLAAGPQFAFNVGGKNIFKDLDSESFELNNSILSLNIGGGVKLLGKLQVGYNYNISLGNTGEMKSAADLLGKVESDFKYSTHQISVAYLF